RTPPALPRYQLDNFRGRHAWAGDPCSVGYATVAVNRPCTRGGSRRQVSFLRPGVWKTAGGGVWSRCRAAGHPSSSRGSTTDSDSSSSRRCSMHEGRVMAIVAALAMALAGCAFRSTAKDWSGLSGLDNKPTYYTITTKVGVKLLIVIPFLGDMGISGLTRDLTADIKREGGNEVRIVEGSSEAYFYGFPPFTWIVTPVISTVSAEYLPEAEQYEKDQIEADKNRKEGWSHRWYKPWRWG